MNLESPRTKDNDNLYYKTPRFLTLIKSYEEACIIGNRNRFLLAINNLLIGASCLKEPMLEPKYDWLAAALKDRSNEELIL